VPHARKEPDHESMRFTNLPSSLVNEIAVDIPLAEATGGVNWMR